MTEGFSILSWDWKQSVDIDELNKALKAIAGPARCTLIDTDSDCYAMAVHSEGFTLSKDEWSFLFHCRWRDEYPWKDRNFNPAPLKEVVNFITKERKKQALEEAERRVEAAEKATAKELKLLEELQRKYKTK